MTDREKFIVLLDSQRVQPADAMILLEGDGYNRVDRATSLYAEEYAPTIVLLGSDHRREYGSYSGQELASELERRGVALSALLIEETAIHTRAEADRCIVLARERGWKSVLIVTSPHHQYRSFLTFLKAAQDAQTDLRLINAPAPLSWTEKNPWGTRLELLEDEFKKIDEYQKKGDVAGYSEGVAYLELADANVRETERTRISGYIPYSTQNINAEDVNAVANVLRAEYLTQGPAVEKFERALSRYTGAKHTVAFSSGTAALHAAYFAAGIGSGDEVVLPALTFAATANAACYLGARPVFVDTQHDGNVDVTRMRDAVNGKTKALVVVDYGGRPADLDEARALAKEKNLILIEDAAHALGARYNGKPVGVQADMTMFSFHPVKSITTGEGGAVTTNNDEFAEKMRMFRTHGIIKDRSIFDEKNNGEWYQEMQALGFNYRLTDIQAALGTSQMKRLDDFVGRRRAAAERYRELLAGNDSVESPAAEDSKRWSAWHLYPILLDTSLREKRDAIFSELRSAKIGVQVHYLPVYLHPYYRRLGYEAGLCPNTEDFAAREITLPLYPALTLTDQKLIVRTLFETIAKHS